MNSKQDKNIFDEIEKERQSLKKQKEELDAVINTLKKEVIESDDQERINFRSRRTSMEKAESIRAFVELHKLKTQLSKIIIDTYEKEHRLTQTDKVTENKDIDQHFIKSFLKKGVENHG